MSKFTTVYNNFAGGKVSDKFKGRFDTQQYQNSLEEYKNFFMGKLGGAYKRTGTVITHDLTNLSAGYTDEHTAIPFDTGSGNSYSLFLPNTTFKLDGFPVSPVWIILNDGIGNTQYDLNSEISFRVESGFPAWPSSNGTVFTRGHWTWQQVGDLLFITHTSGEQRPLVLARTSPTTFEINYYDTYQTDTERLGAWLKVPYRKNLSDITFNPAASTLSSSANFFTTGMVGSYIRINKSGSSSICRVNSYSSATVVNVTWVVGGTPPGGATDDWEQSYWCDEFGWPTSVTFHQQRLFWGGTPKKNFDIIWASRLGNLFHMMRERLDQDSTTDASGSNYFGDVAFATDPTDFRPASTQSNAITWISGGRVLMSGTTGGENLISFGAESLDIKENSNYGSANSQVVKAGKDVIFVGKDGRSLRTYRYSDENGSWLSDDLSSKADTLFLDGAVGSLDFPTIKQMAWNPETKQLWVLLSNNKVKILSYDPEYALNGWTDFEIGGDDNKKILSVITLPSPDRSRYETYLAVQRTKESAATNIYFEKIMGEYTNTSILSYSSTDIYDFPRFLDSADLGTADSSGVMQARPNTLGVFFDCIWVTPTAFGYQSNVEVVLAGLDRVLDFTFPADAKVITGFFYGAELKTLPPESGGQYGTSMADLKHIHESYVRLYRSMDFSIGSKDKRSGVELNFEKFTYPDLYTSDQRVQLSDNPDTDGQVIIRSTTPTPLNILSLISKGVAYD